MKLQTRLKVGAAALALALTAAPPRADAAGLGKLTVLSVLGQPLRAEIDITASSEEMPSLQASIASHEAFHRAGVEYASILNGVRVSVSRRADGRPYLSLRSDKPIYDPFIDVLLEMNWASGTLEREYTFLLDPPDATQTTPSVAPTTPANNTANTTAAAVPGSSRKKAAAASPAAPSTPAIAQTEQDTPGSARTLAAVYSVKHGDTLGKIAEKTRPDSINLDQMLVALFRSNPEAFEGGNINRLRAGKILKIPGAAEAASIDAQEAHNFIVAQAGDFAAYRKKLAAVARDVTPSTEEAAGQSSSGKIEPRVEEQTPTVAGKDKLEVSRATPAKGNDAKSLAARTAAIEEDLVARDKALKDANSRIAELDKNLADMKKMLELKSQGMSDAQKLAQAAKPATTPASPAPMAAPAASAPATPATPTTTKAPEEHKPAHSETTAKAEDKAAAPPATSPAVPADAAKPAEETAAAPSSPAPEPSAAPTPAAPAAPAPVASKPDSKKTAPAPAPAEESTTEAAGGFLDSNPEAAYGGAGILALLLGWLGFRRWKQKRDETSSSPEEDLAPPSQNEPSAAAPAEPTMADTAASATPEEASADTLANDFSIASVGEGETNESVDPIAEADVYMAYGRHAQAEEILLDALKNDPTRWAIHLKLLEIYAERQSPKQFEGIASDLHGQTGGQGEEWQQAAALGRQLDPDNTLYQDPAGGEAAAPAPQRKLDPSAPSASATMSADEFDQLAQVLDSPAPPPALDDFSPAAPPPPSDDTPESLDFELDLGGESIHAEQPANAGMDFDLGDGAPAETIAAPAPAPAQAEPSGSGNADIEFDLDSDLPAFNPQAEQTTPAPETLSAAEEPPAFNPDDIGIDIDFPPATSTPTADVTTEIGMDMGAAADNPEEMATPATLPPSFDLSSINLDLDTPPPAPSESSASPETGLTGAPEVDTKLELAAAYEEMGDKEGARELLQEVLNEGNEAQRATARSKLEQLG